MTDQCAPAALFKERYGEETTGRAQEPHRPTYRPMPDPVLGTPEIVMRWLLGATPKGDDDREYSK